MIVYSSSGFACPQRPDRCPGYGYVNSWGVVDLWDYHKLYNVFSGGARFLDFDLACMIDKRAAHG